MKCKRCGFESVIYEPEDKDYKCLLCSMLQEVNKGMSEVKTYYINDEDFVKNRMIYYINDSVIANLIEPPFELYHDYECRRLILKTINKPRNSLVYGIFWKELSENNITA